METELEYTDEKHNGEIRPIKKFFRRTKGHFASYRKKLENKEHLSAKRIIHRNRYEKEKNGRKNL